MIKDEQFYFPCGFRVTMTEGRADLMNYTSLHVIDLLPELNLGKKALESTIEKVDPAVMGRKNMDSKQKEGTAAERIHYIIGRRSR